MAAPAASSVRGAYRDAMTLAVLLLVWGGLNLSFARVPPSSWPSKAGYLTQMILAAVGVAYFVRTWQQPRERLAVGFSLVEIGLSLVLVPLTAASWLSLGRPWDAFLGIQLALISMPLVAPRFLWLGATLIALFAFEAVGLAITERTHRTTLPMEPYLSLAFGAHALAHVMVRARQRTMATEHVRVESEEVALQRLAPVLASIRERLGSQLAVLADAISTLEPTDHRGPTDRAVAKLAAVNRQLRQLAREAPMAAPTDALREAEQRFRARDAHLGATALATIAAVLSGLAYPAFSRTLTSRFVMIGLGLLALSALAHLTLTRRRPSERRAFGTSLAIFLIALTAVTFNHLQYSRSGRADKPFEPFAGHKLLMMGVALIAPLRLRTGLLLVVLIAASALVLYALGFEPPQLPVLEPWATLIVAAMAVGYLFIWEQRRLTELALLRTQLETSALRRRARVFFSLRDRLNSPLQALTLRVAQSRLERQPSSAVQQASGAIGELVALSKELVRLQDELPPHTFPASLDAEGELSLIPGDALPGLP